MKLRPPAAWLIARCLANLPINGEAAGLPGPSRELVSNLASLPFSDRQAYLSAYVAEHDLDEDAFMLSIDNADPAGPAPGSSEADDETEWPPVRFGSLPLVADFPLDILPPAARELAEAVANSVSCPVDFPAVAALAAASGLIGRSASLLVKPGYFESAALFVAVVGSPSSGKSPAIRSVLEPVRQVASDLHDQWRNEVNAWKSGPKSEDKPEKPVLRRLTTSDATTESLAPILAANPRGMVVVPDEMTKWIMSMDQYKGGRGGDRPFYLSAWGGEPVTVDRAKHASEPIIVPHPFITIVGGMTSSMLSALAESKGREDGFTARILFSHPDRIKRPYNEEGVSLEIAAAWSELAIRLWQRPMRDLDGRPAPHVVKLTPQARTEWVRRCQAHRLEQEADDFPEGLEAGWGKLEAYAARFTLILACLRHASDPTLDPADTPSADGLVVYDAWRLVDYFKSHLRRVRAATGGKTENGGDDVQAVLGWIIRNHLYEFSIRDVGNNFDRFKDDGVALADALAWLVARNIVRPRPEPKDGKSKPGRKRSPRYEANPTLWESRHFLHFLQKAKKAAHSEVKSAISEGSEGNEGDSEEKG